MNRDELLADLKAKIAEGEVVAIIGSGVSRQVTGNAPCASWQGLLKDGATRCDMSAKLDPLIDSGDLTLMLAAASAVQDKLKDEYRNWLKTTVGSLPLKDTAPLDAIHALGATLATTNYDDLLSRGRSLTPVPWTDGFAIEEVIRGHREGVIHLHGYFDVPESVVLGIKSYQDVIDSKHALGVLQALRMTKTLLFIGCGDGLADPHFQPLLDWSEEVFAGSPYRHFVLCRTSEVAALEQRHPSGQRLFPLAYGDGYADLVPFLRSLGSRNVRPSPPIVPVAAALPTPGHCFGRDAEIEEIVKELLRDEPRPLPILGTAGIGKTTLSLKAARDPRVAARYGSRRWFVRCEGTKTRNDVVAAVATALGIPVSPGIEPGVLANLSAEPGLLILDNAETPYDADPLAFEDLLSTLGGIEKLALIASFRLHERPSGVPWREAVEPVRLDPENARKTFLSVAGEKFAKDAHLDRLVEAVDRVPLALTLLAHVAEPEPSLEPVWRTWEEKRVSMLKHAGGSTRLTNMEFSYETSITNPSVTPDARRLLSVLGLLPDGIAHIDLEAVFGASAIEAARVLRRRGLAFDEDGRLRVVAPLRAYVAFAHPPSDEDAQRAENHYFALAHAAAAHLGVDAQGGDAGARVLPETANVEVLIVRAVKRGVSEEVFNAAMGLADCAYYIGVGSVDPLRAVRDAAAAAQAEQFEIRCDFALARAIGDTQPELGRKLLLDALAIARRIGSKEEQAASLVSLGRICAERFYDYKTAIQYLDEATTLLRQIGDRHQEGRALFARGRIEYTLDSGDLGEAKFREALALFREKDYALGQANCLKLLGDVFHTHDDRKAARDHYEMAIDLYKSAGSRLGEANCRKSLASLAAEDGDSEKARAGFEAAFALFRHLDMPGATGSCHEAFADFLVRLGDASGAIVNYEIARDFYAKAGDAYGAGDCSWSLSRLADGPRKQQHLDAARAAWQSIGREDLIKKYLGS